jgi:hypothetical protein
MNLGDKCYVLHYRNFRINKIYLNKENQEARFCKKKKKGKKNYFAFAGR